MTVVEMADGEMTVDMMTMYIMTVGKMTVK